MKLQTTDLQIGYPNRPILSNINLKLSGGDFVVLIGKNGSGKSTLLKTLSNILPLLDGSISIDAHSFDKLTGTDKAKKISIVLTDKITVPLTVKEILHLGRQPYSNRFDRLSAKDIRVIDNIVKVLNLQKFLNRSIQELSDGEKQIVMIARSLVQETPIVLLDEPTTHLDIENKAIVLRLLKKVSEEHNKAIVISTHDINLILPLADKIWIIYEGNLTIINNHSDIVSKLSNLYSNKLIRYDHICQTFRLV